MNLDDVIEPTEPNEPQDGVAPVEPTEAAEAPAFVFEGEEGADAPDELPEDAPNWAKALRERNRETARKLKERDRELQELRAAQQPKGDQLGPKPTLESCGYDEDAFERAVVDWNGKKSEAQRKADEQQAAADRAKQEWADRQAKFAEKAAAALPNFDEVRDEVFDAFGADSQGEFAKAALIYADDPRLIAALKNSPAKLAELVALKGDAMAFAIAIGELKGKVKTMPRRAAPPPETVTRGGAPVANSVDKELERLEREADRTGNRTAVIAYRRKMKERAA